MDKINLEDLAVLKYAANNCYVNVVGFFDVLGKDKDFSFNTLENSWSYRDWKNVPIGRARSLYDNNSNISRSGIIGVYDRSKTEQLCSMVYDAVEYLRDNNRCVFDD